MALSITKRILSALQGTGWKNEAVTDRSDNPKDGCLPTRQGSSIVRVGMYDGFGLTDIGLVRNCNEDQFVIADLTRPVADYRRLTSLEPAYQGQAVSSANLLVVADGVGGNAGGERAGRLAVEEVCEYLHCNRKLLHRHATCAGDQVLADLKSALVWAQQSIQLDAEASTCYSHMGTTLTLAYLHWPAVYVAHVGDSRAYIYRPGELLQITRDQTVAQLLADAGAMEPRRVGTHPLNNVLGSLLCYDTRRLVPCVYQRELTPGDQLLLCTDGLTRKVPPGQIVEILESAFTAEEACRELIAAANSAGGTDNTTVVLARFGLCEAGTKQQA